MHVCGRQSKRQGLALERGHVAQSHAWQSCRLCGGDFLTDGFAKLALRSLKALIWITLAGQKMNTTTQRLMESVKALPEPLVAEVLDFADLLRARQLNPSSNTQDPELSSLSGGLENSITFSGAPLDIQQKMRDEWQQP